MTNWDIAVGETLLRRELHDRWGGGRYGGMEPSVKAASVFLFSNPSAGGAFGYKYDGWHSDGTYHYTGDGQEGDQSLALGGNKAVMIAEQLGRTIRVFRSAGRLTTYAGEFELADPPYYRADALDRNGETRSVLVFRLVPTGDVLRDTEDLADADTPEPEELPIEARNIDVYAAERPDEPNAAVRREALLVSRYVDWLNVRGQATCRHRLPIPGGGYMFTDVFNKTTDELIEAKASAARTFVRAGLGQILDYGRFIGHRSRALLLPLRPSDDLIGLLHEHRCSVIWEEGTGFQRQDPPATPSAG
ncbi:hypothetical protein [Isoptericola dokdonensis]|uniref:hypothetical protein n=1 Tax=Isoptericola dokdonensis TaxID=372663 RepID=UPI000831A4DB|nr:hypothetical protein [Isoptericola dokdonensis]